MVFSMVRAQTRFVVLAPFKNSVSRIFRNIEYDNRWHADLLADMQRMRGKVYSDDGAIRPEELSSDGRHKLSIDEESWHVLALDAKDRVFACLRYLDENRASRFDDLWVRHAAITKSPQLGRSFRQAVEIEIENAHRLEMRFGEVGGWAAAPDYHGTIEPVRIILATYGLLGLLGGCAGLATATMRHGSAKILRRIGLSPLEHGGNELPSYYDPYYRCEMEVLRFDSRRPNPKYRGAIAELTSVLAESPVICREGLRTSLHEVLLGVPAEAPGLVSAA